jgi:hypothetical protein
MNVKKMLLIPVNSPVSIQLAAFIVVASMDILWLIMVVKVRSSFVEIR